MEPAAVVDANEDLVRRLRTHAAMDADVFEERFLQPLKRLAGYINVLPATASGLFSGEMGLFRAALECGFFSFQSSDGRIFTGADGVERRHLLEARWRYLCFLAGLFYPIGKSLERLAVVSPEGAVWKRHFMGVTEWAAERDSSRVFAMWGSTDDSTSLGPSNAALAILPQIVGAGNLQMLEDGAADLIAALYEVVAGSAGSSRIAHQVVAGAWQRIMDREAARRPQAFGRLVVGTHLGPYLVGAVRTLVEKGVWKPNESWLKADKDGLYLQWPQAARDLIDFGRSKGYAGWPDDPSTLAALLRAANVVKEEGGDMGAVEIVDGHGEIVSALKIANPLALLEDFDPADYATAAGKTLESVLAADPLSKTEAAQHTPGPQAAPAEPPAQVADTAVVTPETEPLLPPPVMQSAPVAPEPEAEPGAPLKEAPEVSYSDLVPEDIRSDIGNALQVELLGKVVKAWRSRGDNNDTMRRVDNGAAIALKFLTTIMRDATTWVDHMARAGLIYSPNSTPGLRVHKIAMPEGRKNEVPAVILSNLACKRLGL
jgi:conjugal transfer pilus assembly protein TraI